VLRSQHSPLHSFSMGLLESVEYVRSFCSEPRKHLSQSRLLRPVSHDEHVLRINMLVVEESVQIQCPAPCVRMRATHLIFRAPNPFLAIATTLFCGAFMMVVTGSASAREGSARCGAYRTGNGSGVG
jgi:hypothetical protein